MELKFVKPRKSINKAYLKVKPNRSKIEDFKRNLIQLLDRTNDIESEEYHKNLISDFLKKTYYDPTYFINTKGRNDLVIHNGSNAKSTVGVIVEAKKPTNKFEMLTKSNINVKAFQELVLYYLRERITHKNLDIKYLVATNINEWFIFNSNCFEKLFAQNKLLVEKFNDFEQGRLTGTTTDFFYTEIAAPFIAKEIKNIEFTFFNIRDYEKPLRNNNPNDDHKLISLFKLLSPEHLLKLPFANDSNNLDKRFYGELLHIIGLSEIKKGSKKLIKRNKEGQRNTGSFLENTIIQLDSLNKINRLKNPSYYGSTHEERLFHVGLDLTITWINRILFLKLLEAQLRTYHKRDKAYDFLNSNKIHNYDDLNTLFFQVLAEKQTLRNDDVKDLFSKVPYLNSSLFEPTEIEHNMLFISNLIDDKELPIYSSTVLKNENGKKRRGSLSTLQYLFEFLDAYDFSSEGSEEIQEDNKTLINASVLGLIFEKLNGYKDGSFFTPGFITMYMCRETIRKAVIQKFNETKNWNCSDIHSLYDKIDDRDEANHIINNLKICDPAVGSGHFLVSALNELIAIKNDLKILQDRKGLRLKEYQFEVVNDELIVTDENGELFEYNPNNQESQRVQEALFQEKLTIIENCLFGVDINPNSVKICRLRLWIELLKNAYYKNDTELETLPNIDINIKCGNSLISRYGLDSNLSKALKRNNWTIEKYKSVVHSYHNAQSKTEKAEMESLINEIKNDFSEDIDTPFRRQLGGAMANLNETETKINTLKIWGEKIPKDLINQQKRRKKRFEKLKAQKAEIEHNKIYTNAFEWRFEFPEILSNEGEFIGFDAIIGNPPYGVSIKGEARNYLVSNLSKVPDYEIYYWFIDKAHEILRDRGIISYIIPNSILFNVFAQNYRLGLFDNWKLEEILDCTDINIFEDAVVRNIIFQFIKQSETENLGYRKTNNLKSFEELINRERIVVDKSTVQYNNQNWALIFKLNQITLETVKKIKRFETNISDHFEVTQGYIPYRKSDLIKQFGKEKAESIVKNREWHSNTKKGPEYKQEIFGESLSKYNYKNTDSYVWYGKHLATYVDLKFFNQKRLLIREITNPTIIASIVTEELVNDPQIIVAIPSTQEVSIKTLWAIMNSKLATFYHFNSSPKATKGAFPKILVTDIKEFPLPSIPSSGIIEILVDYVFLLNSTDQLNEFVPNSHLSEIFEEIIDAVIFQLYFPIEFEKSNIEFIKHVEKEFYPIEGKPLEIQKEIIHQSYHKLKLKENIIRNNIKEMKIELRDLLMPILTI